MTSVSVVNANGFNGSVATATTTPAITITTTITGVIKGNGTAISTALDTDITAFTLTGFVSGAGVVGAADSILSAIEKLDGNIAAIVAGYVPSTRNLTINGSTQDLSVDRTWTITTTGTLNRISVSGGGGLTPTIDIDAAYVGQASITTLGTITTGTWNGTIITGTYGGTGINNGANTLTFTGVTSITGGGTIALGGFTLTVPATGTAVLGTGGTSRLAYWTGTNTVTGDPNSLIDGTSYLFGYTALASAELIGAQKNQNANTLFLVSNTTSGTAGKAQIALTNSATFTTGLGLESLSAAFTTSGIRVQNSGVLVCSKTAGFNIGTNAATQLAFWTNNVEVGRFNSTGEFGIGMTPVNQLDVKMDQNAPTIISCLNSNATGATQAQVRSTNGTYTTVLSMLGTAFTTANLNVANLAKLVTTSPVGLVIQSNVAATKIWMQVGGITTATNIATFEATGIGVMMLAATPTAFVDIGASIAGEACLRFRAGVDVTTPNDGEFWYINANDRLMFMKNATKVEILSASAVTTEVVVTDTTLTITYNGTTYKILAKA